MPMMGSRKFSFRDHIEELQKAGLTVAREELKTGKPKGAPKKNGKAWIYPVQDFA